MYPPKLGEITLAARINETAGFTLSVADTGIGMSAEDIPIALSPFSQVVGGLNREYEGTGLGLSITKALVELHDGTLEIESAVGIGTTVTIHLPATRVCPVAAANVA